MGKAKPEKFQTFLLGFETEIAEPRTCQAPTFQTFLLGFETSTSAT